MESRALDALIDEFESMVGAAHPGSLTSMLFRPDWKLIWTTAAKIKEGFRGVRYPTPKERQQAWERFVQIRTEASKLAQDERDSRRATSERFRGEILGQIESARPATLFGFDPPDVEEMKGLGRTLSEAGRMLSAHKGEMLAEHKRECFDRIQEIRQSHDWWWEQLGRERQGRRAEREARIRANLERNRERYRKAADALERCRERADELRSQIAAAWNPTWAERAEQWLWELEAKCADIEASLRQIEGWIEEDEERL